MVSRKLKAAIKLAEVPAYELAYKVQLDPTTLSKLMCGIIRIKPDDSRVTKIIEVGRILGIPPEECFTDHDQTQAG